MLISPVSPQSVRHGSAERRPPVPQRGRRPGGGEFPAAERSSHKRRADKQLLFSLFQVFDATNTTRERRGTIVKFAEQNGFKVLKASQDCGLLVPVGPPHWLCSPVFAGVFRGVCVWGPRCYCTEYTCKSGLTVPRGNAGMRKKQTKKMLIIWSIANI